MLWLNVFFSAREPYGPFMPQILQFIMALVVIIATALLVSNNEKIRLRYIIQLLVIRRAGLFLPALRQRLSVIKHVAGFFDTLLAYAAQDRVRVRRHEQAMAGVHLPRRFVPYHLYFRPDRHLQHFRILPLIIRTVGTLLSRSTAWASWSRSTPSARWCWGSRRTKSPIKASSAISRRAACTPWPRPPCRRYLHRRRLHVDDRRAVRGGGIDPNMFSTFIILSIINPYQVEDEPELKLNKLHEDQSFFEMLGEYILAGFKIAMIIAAMLIGFIALISAVNALFSAVLGISFQQISAMCSIRWLG